MKTTKVLLPLLLWTSLSYCQQTQASGTGAAAQNVQVRKLASNIQKLQEALRVLAPGSPAYKPLFDEYMQQTAHLTALLTTGQQVASPMSSPNSSAQPHESSDLTSNDTSLEAGAPAEPMEQAAAPAPAPGPAAAANTPQPAVQGTPPNPTTNVAGAGKQIGTIEGVPTIDPPAGGTALITGVDSSGNLSFGDEGQTTDKLLNDTVCNASNPRGSTNCNLADKGTYAIIHVLKWGPPDSATSGNSIKSIQSTNWYIYHNHGTAWSGHWGQADFSGNNRFYGATKIVFLYVHLNAAVDKCNPYQVRYQLTISRRVPSNIQAVQQLAQLIFPSAPQPGALAAPPLPCPSPNMIYGTSVWGGRIIDVGYKTSDIIVDSYLVSKNITAIPSTSTSAPLSASLSLINEAKQWWDVSIAVPVKSVNSLQYTSSNNTVVPKQISKQNVFAALDFYLPPVDLAGTTYSFIPHPMAGVSLASQPLHSILVGGAIGLSFAELFAGADFVKQQSLTGVSSGGPATPSQLSAATSYKYKAQFLVGINLPVKAAASAMKKTTK